MMMCVGLVALGLTSVAVRAEPAQERARELIGRLPPLEQRFFEGAKFAGTFALGDLLRLWNAEGRVYAAFTLPDAVVRQFTDPARLIVGIEGSPHLWTLHRSKAGTLDDGLSMVTLTCYAPDEATATFSRFALSSDGSGVVVAGSQMYAKPGWEQTLTLGQTTRAVTVTWRLQADRFAPKRAQATEFGQLPARLPAAVWDDVRMVLGRLGAARPASDVYRAFDQIPADPAVTKKVRPLLRELEAPAPEAREAAMARIRALGRPGVLACLRREPSLLSPEQASRLRALYATEGWVHVEDPEAARSDPEFLRGCLEDEDPRVRSVARNTLAALAAIRQLRK
jgi:hypothetical protein